MENNNFRRLFILFAAQIFLTFSYFVVLDLAYRWDSLVYQMEVRRIIDTVFLLGVLAFIAACIFSILFSGITALIRKARSRLAPLGIRIPQFLIFVLFAQVNFVFLRLWINKTILAQHFDRDARIISLAALLGLFVVFLLLHWFILRKPVEDDDKPKVIGILIFSFALMIVGSILLSIVIQHHESKTAFFQKYGLVMFLAYYVLYRGKVHAVLNSFRLFIIPAIIILAVSIAGTVYAFVGLKSVPEIEITDVQDQSQKKGDVKNIIMITFDGLSANRMSLYGNERPTTPIMDELAKTSYVFDNMHAEADNTIQSVSAMVTGVHYYGVDISRYGVKLAGGNIVGYMPRVFDKLGWDSVYLLYGSNLHLGRGKIFTFLARYNDLPQRLRRYIYSIKFYEYFYAMSGRGYPFSPGWMLALYNGYLSPVISWFGLPSKMPRYSPPERVAGPGGDMYNMALDYLDNTDRPYFLWLHNWAPHQPYIRAGGPFLDDPSITYEQILADGSFIWNSPPLDPQYEEAAKKLRLLSEEYIAGTDAALGRFLGILKSEGLFDNSMLIISTDHGQAFEKGDMFHLTGVMYEQTARIPLIIHMPGQTKGKRIKTLAQHTDLMPTILDTLGMPVPDWMEGESLWKYIAAEKGAPIARTTFSQAIPEGLSFAKSDQRLQLNTFLVYKDGYKLIYRFFANRNFTTLEPPKGMNAFLTRYPPVELFNLTKDPNEDHNIADEEPAIADELMALARERIKRTRQIRVLEQ